MPKFNWNIVFIFSEFIYRREILELSSPPHSFIFSQQNNMVRHSHHKNKNPQSVLMIFPVLSIIFAVPTNSSTKILEEMVPVVVPQAPTTEIKCGACPCVNPCGQQSLPPPPPPPPRFTCCNTLPPTPPPPTFYYVTGVPGQLYGVDPDDSWRYFSNAGRNFVGGFVAFIWLWVVGALHYLLSIL